MIIILHVTTRILKCIAGRTHVSVEEYVYIIACYVIHRKGMFVSGVDFKGQQQLTILYNTAEVFELCNTRTSIQRLKCDSKVN